MPILAQHGSKDGGKINKGIVRDFIYGAIMSPKDLTFASLKEKINEFRQIKNNALILFDPQYYATLVASELGARIGNLPSEYSWYFSEMQIKDLRREKHITDAINKTYNFQKEITGLSGLIMPNILIEDGLRSESANISKLFIELSDEIVKDKNESNKTWLTIALGNSCFRSMKNLEDLANEITGMGLNSKGIYLLCEASPGNGVNPWYEQHMLAGLMYLNYALSSSGYDIINGYSFDNAPFLAAAGGSWFGSGWYNTSRYFSLDKYRASQGMARRPNRKYLCRALWMRLDFATIRPFWQTNNWLLNGTSTDELFKVDNPTDDDECQQHWETLKKYTEDIAAIKNVKEKIAYLKEELNKAQQYRSKIFALAIPNFEDQIRELKVALTLFQELAEF